MIVKDSINKRSICIVKAPDYNGIKWLKRIADIDENGRIVSYDFDPEKPMVFANRNRIFYMNGPDEEGFIGVWNWTAIPNLSDGGKDYIDSHFDSSESPILIIDVFKAHSLDDLIEYLKNGIKSACNSSLKENSDKGANL